MKVVLCVSGQSALWVCFQRGEVIDSFAEQVPQINISQYKPPAWACAKGVQVNLLLDCEQTEIDAHPLQDKGTSVAWRSNKNALVHRLLDQSPNAIVRTANKKTKLGAALVHHLNVQEDINKWLQRLESIGLILCSVTTVSEVLAVHCGEKNNSPGSVVVSASCGFIRHTFCRSGHALFTRSVASTTGIELVEQFEQTLVHLSECGLVEQPVPVYLLGIDKASKESLEALDLVEQVDSAQSYSATRAIEQTQTNAADSNVQMLMATQLIKIPLIRTENENRVVSFELNNFNTRYQHFKLISQCAAVSIIAVSLLVFAASSEWKRMQATDSYQERKAQLSSMIDQFTSEAQAYGEQYRLLSDALFDKVVIESLAGVSPVVVLTVIAEAFTEYRQLRLQELHWEVIDYLPDSISYADTASGFQVASKRQPSSDVEIQPSLTRIRISGSVISGNSLREKQDAINSLVAHLEKQELLSNFILLNTPLMQVNNNALVVTDGDATSSQFQIQFDIDRVESRET